MTDALYEAGYASNSSAYAGGPAIGMTPAAYRAAAAPPSPTRCQLRSAGCWSRAQRRDCVRSGSVTRPRRWKWSLPANSPPLR